MVKISIPEITDQELLARYGRIKPVVSHEWRLHWLRDYSLNELKSRDFLNNDDDIREAVTKDEIRHPMLWDFYAVHPYSFMGRKEIFVADILAQIPDEKLDAVRAFEVKEANVSYVAPYFYKMCRLNGLFVSNVILYL